MENTFVVDSTANYSLQFLTAPMSDGESAIAQMYINEATKDRTLEYACDVAQVLSFTILFIVVVKKFWK